MNRKQRRANKKSHQPIAEAGGEAQDPIHLHTLGVQAHRGGLHDRAAELIAQAIALNGGMPDFHYNLAIVLRAQGKLQQAAASYERALALKPDYAEAHNNLGNVWKALGKQDKAQNCFERALQCRPGYAEAHYNLGLLSRDLEKSDEAAAHFRSCLAADPEDSRGVKLLLAHLGLTAVPEQTPQAHLVKLYDTRAQYWDQDKSYYGHELVARALRAHAPPAKLHILDAGCGTGLVGMLIRDLAGRLDGVDLSPAMLEKARAKKLYDRLDQGELVSFMAARSDRYDAIVSAATLIHFGDLQAAFRAAAACLRDKGLFVFTLFSHDAADRDFAVAANPNLAQSGCYSHSAGYVERLAREHGLAMAMLERAVHEQDQNGTPIAGLVAVMQRSA